MSVEKLKKIYQVAKELNVGHHAIVEYLEDRGFDVAKKHMSPLSEDMYNEVVKKFDPARWNKQLEEETRAVEGTRKAEADRARTEQSLKLLDELANQATAAAEALMQQVQEQKSERVRKAEPDTAAEKTSPIDKEKQRADEAERARKDAEEKLRLEEERAERERLEAEQKTKATDQTPAPPKSAAPTPTPRRSTESERRAASEALRKQTEQQRRQYDPSARSSDQPRTRPAEGQRRPYDPARKQSDQPRAAGEGRPGQPARTGTDQRPTAPRAPRTGPPAVTASAAAPSALKPKDGTRKLRPPSKEDIEQLERQKKLLAQQKADKYRKTVVGPDRDSSARKKQRRRVDQKEVSASIKQTLASIDATKKKHRRKDRTGDEVEADTSILKLTEFVNTQELANLMDVEVNEVISKFISMGKLVSINQRLDKDLIELVADEFGYSVEFVSGEEEHEEEIVEEEAPEDLLPRPPVVTVMGHVDHGKTSLLDFLRKTAVVSQEHGGITQHVGAYEVKVKERSITFLDTPGHEAFTAMRARGAQVTDIVILVVAADDQVRPQTVEAINHAQSAGVPIVVAINKVDKPTADPERIRQQLAERNVLVEQWGGKYQSAEISAKFGTNIEKLLEEVVLTADILELKANPNRRARATVIETRLDKGRGIVATLIITAGTLKVGDNFVAGQQYGKVRALLNELNEPRQETGPGQPVQVVGFSGAPQAGDTFVVFESEREVREIAMRRQLLQREQTFRQIRMMSLDQISQRIKEGGLRELSLIIKGDADGSVEAICDTLQRLATSEVAVKIVHRGVGAISESDVLLASATQAIILGFHVHPNLKARDLAQREQIDIRVYRVIYEMEDDIRKALEGMLAPDTREDVIGLVEIREVFNIPKIGQIAGCYVVSGKVTRANMIRLIRDGREIWRGKVSSLRRFKDDVREVKAGLDCGIGLETNQEIKMGDSLEVYEITEIKRKLESSTA